MSQALLEEFMRDQRFVDLMYEAMAKNDLSELVSIAIEKLTVTNRFPKITKKVKNDRLSKSFRADGNNAYKAKRYQAALICYNKALLYATQDSATLLYAYSNRSALLFSMQEYQACLSDINTCFDYSCPAALIVKLEKRRDEAYQLLRSTSNSDLRLKTFADEYFNFNVRSNPQIASATIDVGVMIENRIPKIVAAKEIKIGAVIAKEQAYASNLNGHMRYSACYYCHKTTLNLMPCNDCCFVLFCNQYCRRQALDAYHSYECDVMDTLETVFQDSVYTLALKAAFKLKGMKTWKMFNELTQNFGLKRMRQSEVNEVFDGNNMSSMLNFKDDRTYPYNAMFRASFRCATIIKSLLETSFFHTEESDDMESKVRAFSRVIMYFALYPNFTHIYSTSLAEFCDTSNLGIFPLIGKMKHDCNPNLIAVGLCNQVALVAIKPIRPGTELTYSFMGHFLDNCIPTEIRKDKLQKMYQIDCNCVVCTGEWSGLRRSANLSEAERRQVGKLDVKFAMDNFQAKNIALMYPHVCKILSFLCEAPFTNEYLEVYGLFRRCIVEMQDRYCGNS